MIHDEIRSLLDAPPDGEDAPTLLRSAELALQSAKERGRNRVEFYSPATGVLDFDRLHIKTGLSSALEKGELEIVYQPKVRADTGEIHGVEAPCSERFGDGCGPSARAAHDDDATVTR